MTLNLWATGFFVQMRLQKNLVYIHVPLFMDLLQYMYMAHVQSYPWIKLNILHFSLLFFFAKLLLASIYFRRKSRCRCIFLLSSPPPSLHFKGFFQCLCHKSETTSFSKDFLNIYSYIYIFPLSLCVITLRINFLMY